MICYRDKTFCSFKDCKKFSTCDRALTNAIQRDARRWWQKDNPPISIFTEKPKCFKER